jgi:hypothetical protein
MLLPCSRRVATSCIRMSRSCAVARSSSTKTTRPSVEQNVLRLSSTHGRDQGPCTLAPRKQDPSRSGHSKRRKLVGYSIASTGPRHVVLASAHTTRVLALGRVDIGLADLHRSLHFLADKVQWLQDSPLHSTVVTVYP